MTRSLNAFSTGWIVFFAGWAAIALSGTALRLGLTAVTPGVFIALLAGLAAARREFRLPLPVPAAAAPAALPARLSILGAGLALAAMPFVGSELVWPWAAALAAMLAAMLMEPTPSAAAPPAPAEASEPAWAGPCLALALVAALAVTLLSNRISWDDDRYIWMARHLVRHPGDPIFDLLTVMPGREEIYAWHPHEILAAALERLTGIGAVYHYDYTLPVVGALLTVSELHLCARLFVGRLAAATALICVTMLIAWGGSHQSLGNFSFDRLFDGKCMLASWAAPAIFRQGVRFGREGSRWTAAMLAAALMCGIAQHHSAILIGPLAAISGVFAGRPDRSRTAAPLIAAGVALAIYGLALMIDAALPFFLVRKPAAVPEAFALVFQADYRSALTLAAVALAGLLLTGMAGRTARRGAFMGVALTLNPFLMAFISRAIGSLSWRELWSFPFILFAGLALTGGALREMKFWRIPVLSAAALVLFLTSGTWTVSPANNNHFGEIGLKIDDTLRSWIESGSDILLPKRR